MDNIRDIIRVREMRNKDIVKDCPLCRLDIPTTHSEMIIWLDKYFIPKDEVKRIIENTWKDRLQTTNKIILMTGLKSELLKRLGLK